MSKLTPYSKALIALGGAALVLVAELVVPEGAETVVQIVLVAATGGATYRVPNTPKEIAA